jgi:hypothetical protein
MPTVTASGLSKVIAMPSSNCARVMIPEAYRRLIVSTSAPVDRSSTTGDVVPVCADGRGFAWEAARPTRRTAARTLIHNHAMYQLIPLFIVYPSLSFSSLLILQSNKSNSLETSLYAGT